MEQHHPRIASNTLLAVQRVLEDAGAEFIDGGVRCRRDREPTADLLADLRAIAAKSSVHSAGQATLTVADLYDEDGLPA